MPKLAQYREHLNSEDPVLLFVISSSEDSILLFVIIIWHVWGHALVDLLLMPFHTCTVVCV
jgi:hypothetical protein